MKESFIASVPFSLFTEIYYNNPMGSMTTKVKGSLVLYLFQSYSSKNGFPAIISILLPLLLHCN